ncbi:MAG: hypothetical protein Kow0075_00370 [Salibacteraceae bacterium]
MKSDIEFPTVRNVAVCATPRDEQLKPKTWEVHVVNLNPHTLQHVLVSSHGYGIQNNAEVETSRLRFYFEQMPPKSHLHVELIPENLVGLSNEYWVSFYLGGKLFDKKYIFLPDSLIAENLISIPLINRPGVMIL